MLETIQDTKRILALLGAGLDSELAGKAVTNGYSLTKLKSTPKSELERVFSENEIQAFYDLRRRPIAKDTVQELIEKCHWKCCLCWEYRETQPVVIHHLIEHSRTQDDSYDNLVILCLNHHAAVHSKWEISRHPWPPELIKHRKSQWEQAVSDFVSGRRPAPSTKFELGFAKTTGLLDWSAYLQSIKDEYAKWHIPDEISFFIDWDVIPVPPDSCIRLILVPEKPLFQQSELRGEQKKRKAQRVIKIAEAITNQAILIIGSAGAGKSTCLRYLCHEFASQALDGIWGGSSGHNVRIPILVSLRHYGINNIFSLMYAQLRKHNVLIGKEDIDNVLGSSDFTLLLDGLDEVQPKWRDELLSDVATFRDAYPNVQVVLTSRKEPRPGFLNGFIWYEIARLEQSTSLRFAEAYLGYYNRYAFMHFIEEHRLEEIVQTPLLLTLCLILFRRNTSNLHSMADIYRNILELYKISWEDRKKTQSIGEPLEWMILERALAVLAYQMHVRNLGYSITREQALQVLAQETKGLGKEHFWSSKHTAFDLLSQLLLHNLLEIAEGTISFWHTSFQHYFAALYISQFRTGQVVKLVNQALNAQTIAFLGGLLTDPKSLVDLLVKNVWECDDPPQAVWSLEILGAMGEKFTGEIIRAISEPSFPEVHYTAYAILESRNFEGKPIFNSILEILSTIDAVFMGELSLEDLDDSFPDPDRINFNVFEPLFKNIMLAISQGYLDQANTLYKQLLDYIESLTRERVQYDWWLGSQDLDDLDKFRACLNRGGINVAELRKFCRNTLQLSSVPFLEAIVAISSDFSLGMEARSAIQSIIRR